MSFPCINTQQFQMVGGTHLQPQDYMQWRHVATSLLDSNTYSYTAAGADPEADLVQHQVQWTNTSPISQLVYCMITRGATRVVTQARSLAHLDTYFAVTQGAAPADPNPIPGTLIGAFGNGSNIDVATGALFLITETRTAEHTYPIGSTVTLPAGHTYKLRIRLRWATDFWETSVEGGLSETESSLVTGATRLDLFSIPVIT